MPPALSSENTTAGVKEIGADHLTAAHGRPFAQLPCFSQLAFLFQRTHADAALGHDAAVRLLHHHANDPGRRLQVVARKRGSHFTLRLDHRKCAHRLVALLEPGIALRTARPG
jgi:hypothetical protein